MSRLSTEARQQLDSAFDEVAAAVDDGVEPTAAVIKVAQRHKLGPGYGETLGRLFNTGQTTVQRLGGTDPAEKIAECPLVDTVEVRRSLEQKEAADQFAAIPVSTDYERPPLDVIRKRAEAKLAEFVAPPLAKKPEYWHRHAPLEAPATAPEIDNSLNLAIDKIATIRREVSKVREYVGGICKHAGEQVEKFLHFMRRTDAPTPAWLQKEAQDNWDKDVDDVMERLKDFLPPFGGCQQHLELNTRGEAYRLAKEAAEAQILALAALEEQDEFEALAATKIAELLRQPGQVCLGDDPFDDINGLDKQAFLGPAMSGALAGGMGRSMAGQNADSQMPSRVQSYLHALNNPAHEQRLGAIHARTAVEQLMATDPVLRGYHADDVTEAYNQLIQAAPRGANQSMWLQSMLRRVLGQGGALDPDDVKSNVYGTDKALLEQAQGPRMYESQQRPPELASTAPRGGPLDRLQGAYGAAEQGVDKLMGNEPAPGAGASQQTDQTTNNFGAP